MNSIPIHVFKDSFRPIKDLLQKHDISYKERQMPKGVVYASGSTLEIVLSATIWASLAAVLIAFIKARHSRKIIITTKDNRIVHGEGLTAKDMEIILRNAKDIMAAETEPEDNDVK